jgi:predicted alpha/beta hydrolase
MPKQSIRVPAWEDGFPLAVTVFTPEADISDPEKIVVLISGATGCWQYYYAAFATYSLGGNRR